MKIVLSEDSEEMKSESTTRRGCENFIELSDDLILNSSQIFNYTEKNFPSSAKSHLKVNGGEKMK